MIGIEKEFLLSTVDKTICDMDHLPFEIQSILEKILKYRVDPSGDIYTVLLKDIIKDAELLNENKIIGVSELNEEMLNEENIKKFDPILESFIRGVGGQITFDTSKVYSNKGPFAFRGITKMKYMNYCKENNLDFYYIDTGYFGNDGRKHYHRITKNDMQFTGPILKRERDRLDEIRWRPKKFRPGRTILICPPSNKAMTMFGLDLDVWLEETIKKIKIHTDRPIVIRNKPSRRERVTTNTIEQALDDDVHCLVTYNSIAATEALLLGKPAFTLGPNAARNLSLADLSKIETPYIPSLDQIEEFAAHLAYCQFTEKEMSNGTAWKILNETSDILSSSSEK